MTDHDMLEAAARAARSAGIGVLRDPHGVLRDCTGMDPIMNMFAAPAWRPREDDGTALRLAVALGLQIRHYPIYDTPRFAVLVVDQRWSSDAERDASEDTLVHYDGDPCAATRHAIVRAAAATVGK